MVQASGGFLFTSNQEEKFLRRNSEIGLVSELQPIEVTAAASQLHPPINIFIFDCGSFQAGTMKAILRIIFT